MADEFPILARLLGGGGGGAAFVPRTVAGPLLEVVVDEDPLLRFPSGPGKRRGSGISVRKLHLPSVSFIPMVMDERGDRLETSARSIAVNDVLLKDGADARTVANPDGTDDVGVGRSK